MIVNNPFKPNHSYIESSLTAFRRDFTRREDATHTLEAARTYKAPCRATLLSLTSLPKAFACAGVNHSEATFANFLDSVVLADRRESRSGDLEAELDSRLFQNIPVEGFGGIVEFDETVKPIFYSDANAICTTIADCFNSNNPGKENFLNFVIDVLDDIHASKIRVCSGFPRQDEPTLDLDRMEVEFLRGDHGFKIDDDDLDNFTLSMYAIFSAAIATPLGVNDHLPRTSS